MGTSKIDLSRLSVAERIQLVEDIWDSIVLDAPDAVPLTDAQRFELRSRIAAHDANPDSAFPWEQVRDELFRR